MTTKHILERELNRLVAYLLTRDDIAFSECVQNWYREGYECKLTPKPSDTDPLRLAAKAAIMERLAEVLNTPPRSGNQTPPDWCAEIDGVEEPLKLQSDALLEGEVLCEPFAKRNLLVVKNFMYFV